MEEQTERDESVNGKLAWLDKLNYIYISLYISANKLKNYILINGIYFNKFYFVSYFM